MLTWANWRRGCGVIFGLVREWLFHAWNVSKLYRPKNMQALLEHAYTRGRVDVVNAAFEARKAMNRQQRRALAKKHKRSVSNIIIPD